MALRFRAAAAALILHEAHLGRARAFFPLSSGATNPIGRRWLGWRHKVSQRIKHLLELISGVATEGIVLKGESLGLLLQLIESLWRVRGGYSGLSFGLALFSALRDGEKASAWLVALGGTGELLFGLAIFFGTAVRQRPIIREFLNVEAIREAGRQQDL